MSRSHKKIIYLSSIFLLLFFSSVLFYNKKEIFGIEQPIGIPAIAQDWEEIKLYGLSYLVDKKFYRNKKEIPIGKSVEGMEDIAHKTINALASLIYEAQGEARASDIIIDLVEQCGKNPYGCQPRCEGETKKSCVICGCATREYCEGLKQLGYEESPEVCKEDCEYQDCKQFGADFVCCCKVLIETICHPKPCTGNACPPGISAQFLEIERRAEAMETAWSMTIDPYMPRFLPITLANIQYGISTISELRKYIIFPDWLNKILPCTHGNIDQISKDICAILIKQRCPRLHEDRFWDLAGHLCITPAQFHSMAEKPENIPGYLDTSRRILEECKIYVVSPEVPVEELPKEFTGIMRCETIQSVLEYIPVRSFLERGDPKTTFWGKLREGCFGNRYCQKFEDELCAEDYYCCHF